jgi:hypothetical protein
MNYQHPAEIRLYQVEVGLFHDAEPDPINAAMAIIAGPILLPGLPTLQGAGDLSCSQANQERLRQFLSLSGAKPPELVD